MEKLSMRYSMPQTAKCTPRKRLRVKRRFQATTIPHAERFFRTTGKIWCVLECTLTAFIDAPALAWSRSPDTRLAGSGCLDGTSVGHFWHVSAIHIVGSSI